MSFLKMILLLIRALILSREQLSIKLLMLRQQLVVLRCTVQRPQARNPDRLFWVVLSRIWKDWRKALVIVKPETVVKWHRQNFKMYRRWRSSARTLGRPKVIKEIRELIGRISNENPLCGVPVYRHNSVRQQIEAVNVGAGVSRGVSYLATDTGSCKLWLVNSFEFFWPYG